MRTKRKIAYMCAVYDLVKSWIWYALLVWLSQQRHHLQLHFSHVSASCYSFISSYTVVFVLPLSVLCFVAIPEYFRTQIKWI